MKPLVKEIMTKTVTTVTPETSLQDLAKIFKKEKISGAPVIGRDGKLLGVITKSTLLNVHLEKRGEFDPYPEFFHLSGITTHGDGTFDVFSQISGAVKDYMTKNAFTVQEEQSVSEAAQAMFENRIHRVIVTREGKVTGMVSTYDVLKTYPLLDRLESIGREEVRSIMKTSLFTIDPGEKLSHAIHLMGKHHIRQLPVVQNKKLLGIITDRDLRSAQISELVQPGSKEENTYYMDTILVQEAMTAQPVTITPQHTIREAALKLRNNKIGSLPVVENDNLVGIVTQSDILNFLVWV